ncbi:hypothetical protein N8I77_013720 [Diaporthe amygdali]|uniref:Uncharacterized protein n=1 Tax=Phomopsis amygdali TaxID=1214568 RepID=A0AAD9S1P4_PHOAM|nr:hypothetical protein N8I77_013720 [Diaporthe amygdali]
MLVRQQEEPTYKFQRHIRRSLLNTLGPVAVTGFYLFIALEYLRRPSVNNISPSRVLSGKGVFYAFFVLSVFALECAKSGLAGFEAWALMQPRLAPANANQLMWHTDRLWGSVSGWWRALLVTKDFLRHRKRKGQKWQGPSGLWFYLASCSLIFFVTVPLAGLSMEPVLSAKLSDRQIGIIGPNQSTFDTQQSVSVAQMADGRWRQGTATTPQGETILYAPEGTRNASSAFLEDEARSIYDLHHKDNSQPRPNITFFSGPAVGERVHGDAWGLLVNVSCVPVNPYTGLQLLNITSVNNWTALTNSGSSKNGTIFNSSDWEELYQQGAVGSSYTLYTDSSSWHTTPGFGVNYSYVMTSDRDITNALSDYSNQSTDSRVPRPEIPIQGSVEMVLWQSINTAQGFSADQDQEWLKMKDNAVVVASGDYLGYGLQCSVYSTVGTASLSAITNTFSDFRPQQAAYGNTFLTWDSRENLGIYAIQTLVYAAFTSAGINWQGRPRPSHLCTTHTIFSTCNGWFGANIATKGRPIHVPRSGYRGTQNNTESSGFIIQYPAISPERMALAMHKLFGEVAIALMAGGPGNWTDPALKGLDPITDIVPGVLPYQLVIILLALWTLLTILPQFLAPSSFFGRRWASVLDGFAMFRFGAEWRGVVHELRGGDLASQDTTSLCHVPGMVGDLEPRRAREAGRTSRAPGFVGLSRNRADVSPNRLYTYHKAI